MAINKSTVIARIAFVAAAVLVAAILTSQIAHARLVVNDAGNICQYAPSSDLPVTENV